MNTDKPKRTPTQNNALHLWLKLKADQCRDAGVTPRMTFEKSIDIEMTPEIMKDIWKAVQRAMYKKSSTTELTKSQGEINEIVEHLNRFFAENFNLEGIEFPRDEERWNNEIK